MFLDLTKIVTLWLCLRHKSRHITIKNRNALVVALRQAPCVLYSNEYSDTLVLNPKLHSSSHAQDEAQSL